MQENFDVAKAKQLIKQIQDALLELDSIINAEPNTSQPVPSQQVPKALQAAQKDQFNQPQTQQPPQPQSPQDSLPALRTVEDVRMLFSEELDALLSFEEKPDYVVVKPKQFLGSSNFAEVLGIIRNAKGEYVSAGRDSHFRIYKGGVN